jgi:hypothetical protein
MTGHQIIYNKKTYQFRVRSREEAVFNVFLLIRSEWVISRSLTVQRLSDLYHTGPCNFQALGRWEQFKNLGIWKAYAEATKIKLACTLKQYRASI